jgi:hypothetical protein
MHADNTQTDHNRTIRLTGIPDPHKKDLLAELDITVGYKTHYNDDQVVVKAITLDSVVIPAIITALNQDETEKAEMIRLLRNDLSYRHEDLAGRYGNVTAALKEYDNLVGARLLAKLEPGDAKQIRAYVKSRLRNSFPTGSCVG